MGTDYVTGGRPVALDQQRVKRHVDAVIIKLNGQRYFNLIINLRNGQKINIRDTLTEHVKKMLLNPATSPPVEWVDVDSYKGLIMLDYCSSNPHADASFFASSWPHYQVESIGMVKIAKFVDETPYVQQPVQAQQRQVVMEPAAPSGERYDLSPQMIPEQVPRVDPPEQDLEAIRDGNNKVEPENH